MVVAKFVGSFEIPPEENERSLLDWVGGASRLQA
jgi:hypothetical protein